MDPITLGLIGGAGISALGGFVTSALNNRSVSKENQIMREREDNAISRRMADLSASGLSPTLAAGSPASSQSGTPKNYDSLGNSFDFASKYLSLLQGKADVSKTNADTAVAKMSLTSEKFKQAFMQAQTEGEKLRNSWINADWTSTLNLRDLQGNKIGKEIDQLNANTALLQAKTLYEQANTDFLATQHENARISQDMLKFDRDMQADTWAMQNLFPNTKSAFGSYGAAILKNLIGGTHGTETKLKKYGFTFGK